MTKRIEIAEIAKDQYSKLGVDVERAMEQLADIAVSIHFPAQNGSPLVG